MTNPVTALLLVATWVSFLWFRDMRTARTVAYLIAATVVYLAADLAPDPWPLLLRLIVAASVLALHLRFSHLLSALPREVLRFWDAYVAINKQMTSAYAEFEKSQEREPLEASVVRAQADLRALRMPQGENWLRLQTMAVDVVGERLGMLQDGTDREPGAAMRFRTHRADVHRQLQLALAQSRRFWR